MTAHINDFRLADFKLLLPLRADMRTLVISAADIQFLPHLAGELGRVDVVGSAPYSCPVEAIADEIRLLAAPDGLYDLVFSDSLDAACHLSRGGTLCHLAPGNPHGPTSLQGALKLVGHWRAFPSWPNFRVLIPDHPVGWRAAMRGLRLLSPRSWRGMVARLFPNAAARILPRYGIALYQKGAAETSPTPCLLQQLNAALQSAAGCSKAPHNVEPPHWMPVSGQLGPGNPMLAFRMDGDGNLRELIKIARYPDTNHLLLEAKQLQLIKSTLGKDLAAKVILPTAAACVERRHALAYDYVPTFTFSGLRWRLQTRRSFCVAMTDWLAEVALGTLREEDAASAARQHCAPLRHLIERNILPPAMQSAAGCALHWLNTQLTLPTVFEHGDLGIYNTRMVSADGSDFKVLDWGSSTFEGIALGDLAYLLSSARAPTALAAECLQRYLLRLQLDTEAAAPLWFSYLARRWAELDTVRAPLLNDPCSGGGVLLAIHDQVWPCIQRLTTR